MDAVELKEPAISFPHLLFHVTIPEVSSETEGAVPLFVQSDVIRAFELDDVIALP